MNALSVLLENVDLTMSAGGQVSEPVRQSLASRLQSEGVKKGEVLFKPSDAFSGFLRIIENNIFFHLLEVLDLQASASTSANDGRATGITFETEFFSMSDTMVNFEGYNPINICAFELLCTAEKISSHSEFAGDDETRTMSGGGTVLDKLDALDFTYIIKPVACIRACIRLIAMKHPQGPNGLLDVLDDLFKKISKIHPQTHFFHSTLGSLRGYLESLNEAAAEGSWVFMAFRDDPYANVLHFSQRYFLKGSSYTSGTVPQFEIKLINSGDIDLQGFYVRTDDSSEEPVYKHKNDFSIVRHRQIINEEGDENKDEHVFIWYIIHLKRSTAYYSCATADSSTLPPSLGWRVVDAGLNPAPTIIITLSSSMLAEANHGVPSNTSKILKNHDNVLSAAAEYEEDISDDRTEIITAKQYDGMLANASEFSLIVKHRHEELMRGAADNEGSRSVTDDTKGAFESFGSNDGGVDRGRSCRKNAFKRVYSFEADAESSSLGDEFKSNESASVTNGGSISRDIPGNIPALNEIERESSEFLNGLIERCDAVIDRYKKHLEGLNTESRREDPGNTFSMAIEGVSDAFREQWTFENILRSRTAKKFYDASIDFTELQYNIQQAMTPEHLDFQTYTPIVRVLGMRLARHDEIAEGINRRRFRYVTRIYVKTELLFEESGNVARSCTEDEDIGLGFVSESIEDSDLVSESMPTSTSASGDVIKRDFPEAMADLLMNLDISDRVVYTLAYDLGELCSLHTSLSDVLIASDIHPPSFPDPFSIEALEESLIEGLFKESDDADTYVYNHDWLSRTQPNQVLTSLIRDYNNCHEDVSLAQTTIACLEGYLADILTLIEEILSNDGSSYEETKSDLIDILRRFFRISPLSGRSTSGVTLKLLPESEFVPVSPSEEELLRRQRFTCAGCGEPLRAGLFMALNSEKNYAYCEHSKSLFCKRWCHFDSTLPLPQRVLETFDLGPVKVSDPSLHYLRMMWRKPIIEIDTLNPHLINSVSVLYRMREKRRQAISYLRDFTTTDVSTHKLSQLISDTIGFEHSYLFMHDSLYSMEDLVSLRDERLLVKMSEFITALAESREFTM